MHIALEPTGALPLAAYLAGKFPKGRAGLILSGGNANFETVAKLLGTR
jgi:threonine dehydratase